MRLWWKKRGSELEREQNQLTKIRDSQNALLDAATSTANAAHDVTSVIKQRLNDSLAQLEITGRMMSDALLLCDSEGRILSMNQAAERIFGWDSKTVCGRPIEILFRRHDGRQITFPALLDALDNHAQGGYFESPEYDVPMDSLRGKRRNGDLFWIDVNISHLTRTDGQHFMLIARDVTDKVETLRQLGVNEQRYRAVFDNSTDGILVVEHKHIVDVNLSFAAMLGYTTYDMIAHPLENFMSMESKTLCELEFKLRETDSTTRNYMAKFKCKDGTSLELLVSSKGIRWSSANAILMFGKDLNNL